MRSHFFVSWKVFVFLYGISYNICCEIYKVEVIKHIKTNNKNHTIQSYIYILNSNQLLGQSTPGKFHYCLNHIVLRSFQANMTANFFKNILRTCMTYLVISFLLEIYGKPSMLLDATLSPR